MEHVTRGEDGLTLGIHLPIRSLKITVPTNDLLSLWIPDNQLLIAVLTDIKIVDIHILASATTCLTKNHFAQTPNFLHDIGCIMRSNDVDFVMTFVSHSQLALWCQLTLENLFVNGLDNLLFHQFCYWL